MHAVECIVGRACAHIDGGAPVGCHTHLVGIPVGGKIGEVDNAHVGAEAFHLLGVPQGECVIVAICENYGVVIEAREVIHAEIAGGVAPGAVVVVPCLADYL